jgi:hypothetical protein
MNVRAVYTTTIIYIITIAASWAQMNPKGVAPGMVYPLEKTNQAKVFPLPYDPNMLLQEDALNDLPGFPYRIGKAIPVYDDLFNMGIWMKMDDGRSFFRAVFSSPGALSVNIAFEDFYLPESALLFFYNPAKTNVFGGYNSSDNHQSRMFPGPLVEGDQIIVEYMGPDPASASHKPSLIIKDIMYFYRPLDEDMRNQSIGASDTCQVNVNCPEGDDWQTQKRGIARILLRVGDSGYFCSGTLINNTSQDGTPYFLTAEHCGSGASEADHNLWQFRFNFERETCEEAGTPRNQTITGSSLVAIAEMAGGSDMRLLRLNFTPPASYQPYYNGWDRTPIPARNGVGIHHPAGDVKKISTFSATASNVTNPVVSGSAMAANSVWNVTFIATETHHGVTQAGSSGSPLFNQNGLVVGSLTGGSSSCSFPNGSNLYGKINFHWESNGTEPARQLKPWLDPLNTGQLTLNGLDIYPIPVVEDLEATVNNDLSVNLTWEIPDYDMQQNWYGYTSRFTNVMNETPERAVRFNFKNIIDADTFYLSAITHLFWQHPNHPWGTNNKFTFKIYDQNGSTLLYQSEQLTALNFQSTNTEVEHKLKTELVMTRPFYVAVVPVRTGQPSSLALERSDSTSSYYGSAGNWQRLRDGSKFFELLVYVRGSTRPADPLVQTKSTSAHKQSQPFSHQIGLPLSDTYTALEEVYSLTHVPEKVIGDIRYYNIYRDSVLIASTTNARQLSYTDTADLTPGQTYMYQVSSVINLNPANPAAPFTESELSAGVRVVIAPVDTNLTAERKIRISPNPSSGSFILEGIPDSDTHIEMRVSDIRGAVVYRQLLTGRNAHQIQIPFIGSGVYFLTLLVGGELQSYKLVIQ